ncbi:conserved hypothetical protein [methanotrophic bacterial endosymbiont of Bathymodiolus sp.]|nr:conserved hypothetical protein [methanotrophic bacterial endosymbiont of Bathymodiolus sp.]
MTKLSRQVFPTPVGVFLPRSITMSKSSGLPHARGGVSYSCQNHSWLMASSPRPWGCF